MDEFTRLTNLEVTGSFKQSGLTKSTYIATKADPAAAAGTAPTKAEFDAVVDLVKELKSKHNKLASQYATGSDT